MIVTDRLILRPWRRSDIRPFYAMGQDREVMRFYGPRATMADCRRDHDRMTAIQRRYGHCFWALERRSDARFIGFCGLLPGGGPIDGEVEIGWRLARDQWGQGLALEAARASLAWSWKHLAVRSIAAVTVPANKRSRRLIERLGMVRAPEGGFEHPELAAGDPLRSHLLYRIARPTHG